MPPGPFPLPFIGNMLNLLSDNDDPYGKLSDKYGDIFTLTFPSATAVILSTAELVREASLTRPEDIAGKSDDSFYPFQDIFGADVITSDYTEPYRFRRRVFQKAVHVFRASVETAEGRARRTVSLVIDEIEGKEGKPFSPRQLFECAIIVQLWEWITSEKVSLDDENVKSLRKFNALVSSQSLQTDVRQLLPFLKHLPLDISKKAKQARQIRYDVFPPIFRNHYKTYTPGIMRDLIDGFINAYQMEIAKETSKNIGSVEDIPNLLLDLVFAGSDTTSGVLAWFVLYVVLNEDVQNKIHQEIDIAVGRDRLPVWEDTANLHYLQASICEILRITGLVPVLGRNAIRDTTIAGYHIPKNTFIGINIAKCHLQERDWPDPHNFNPERFLDGDGNFLGWKKNPNFIPFGLGRRECAGQSLAKLMLFTFTSTLMHRYKFELPEGAERPSTDVTSNQVVKRPQDYQVVVKQRF